MFENWGAHTHKALYFSRQEANLMGSTTLGAEHLLLGLIREAEEAPPRFSILSRVLGERGLSLSGLRERVESSPKLARSDSRPLDADILLGTDAKKVLVGASAEAVEWDQPGVSCHHLFLALLGIQDTLAYEILSQQGFELLELRRTISRQLEEIKKEPERPSVPTDKKLHPWETRYTEKCPACGEIGGIRDYKYHLMAQLKARGAVEALQSFLNTVATSASVLKRGFFFLLGERRKVAPQALCTGCMARLVKCPYCNIIHQAPGKNAFELTLHPCSSCEKSFDISV